MLVEEEDGALDSVMLSMEAAEAGGCRPPKDSKHTLHTAHTMFNVLPNTIKSLMVFIFM